MSGFKTHRFRDQQLMLAHVEYRWLIWDHGVWALLRADAGEVAPSLDQFRMSERHTSYGGGFRVRLSGATVGRLDIAHSDEGLQVYIDLKGDF